MKTTKNEIDNEQREEGNQQYLTIRSLLDEGYRVIVTTTAGAWRYQLLDAAAFTLTPEGVQVLLGNGKAATIQRGGRVDTACYYLRAA